MFFFLKDLASQSDRRGFLVDGIEWNKWLCKNRIVVLYASLLGILATDSRSSAISNYWPDYPVEVESDRIKDLIQVSFWEWIFSADCSDKLFPVECQVLQEEGPFEITYTEPRLALLNLLGDGSAIGGMMDVLLPKMVIDPWKLVKPTGVMLKALTTMRVTGRCPKNFNVLSPASIVRLLRQEKNAVVLQTEWTSSHQSDIKFINTLLKYIAFGGEDQREVGVNIIQLANTPIIPLADKRLGKLSHPPSPNQNFFIAGNDHPLLTAALLEFFAPSVVHPGLDQDVLKFLAHGQILKIPRFSFVDHLASLLAKLTQPDKRSSFLAKVWQFYNTMEPDTPESEQLFQVLNVLPTVVARVAPSLTEHRFVRPSDYRSMSVPTMLHRPLGLHELREATPAEHQEVERILHSLDHLLLVDHRTVPSLWLSQSALEFPEGLYRLLVCIEMLSTESESTLEAFLKPMIELDPEYPEVGSPPYRF